MPSGAVEASAASGLPLAGLPVNFHITPACNFSCGHCFATFDDVSNQGRVQRDLQLRTIRRLAQAGTSKVTFSGGEPLLVPWLDDLVGAASALGLTTCIVTNGLLVTDAWLNSQEGHLDWLTLSVDSFDAQTSQMIGRVDKKGRVLSFERATEIRSVLASTNVGLRLNTVVTAQNVHDTISTEINMLHPARWKIMQSMHVLGQQPAPREHWETSDDCFATFVSRNLEGLNHSIQVTSETATAMRGSYLMLDPWGRVFDSVRGFHTYGEPLIVNGLSATVFDDRTIARLRGRGGLWAWQKENK